MNYEDLVFSEKLAQQRIAQAENILGKKVVQKMGNRMKKGILRINKLTKGTLYDKGLKLYYF